MLNETKQALSKMNQARQFPGNTDPCSRHVAIMAETLASGRPYPAIDDEREHCAASLAYTVAALWELRTERDKDRAAMRQALEALELELMHGPLIAECHAAISTLKARLGDD